MSEAQPTRPRHYQEPVEWGDPRGPAVIGSILIALLSLSLVLNTRRLMAGEI